MKDDWLLIDSNYLCHRARWSMGDLAWQGRPTGVIYGFLSSILQLQKRFDTNNVAFCFDSQSSLRKAIYPNYKAHRKNRKPMKKQEEMFEKEFHKQIKLLRTSYLPEIGFNNIFLQKGYESDDLLAQIAKDIHTILDVIIVTADKDLFQCITTNISVYNPHKHIRMTYQRFYQTYKILPTEWILVKALAGCTTDNVKGLPNIGEKTVLKWMWGELNHSTKACKLIISKQAKAIQCGNLPLVLLPFDGTKKIKLQNDNISKTGWRSVCKRLGFKSLIDNTPKRKRKD